MGMKVYSSGAAGHRTRRRRGRGNPRRILLAVAVLVLVFALVYLLLPFGGSRVVLLGSDARANEASRSDTIVIAKPGGGMLAVPRDTRVEIPGVGKDKINAAFANGGPELTVQTLEDLTGVKMNKYVVVDFGAVEEIVNALGGIILTVDEPIEYNLDGRYVSIPAGTQELNGADALGYVRYRGTPTADIGRIGRQRKFLQALASEATSPSKLPRLPATARAVWSNIDTNMNPAGAVWFALKMRLSGMGDAELYPGTPQYIGGISYWVPDKQAGDQAVKRTIE